jgi:3-methyladenine DNA glycosylase AlkD
LLAKLGRTGATVIQYDITGPEAEILALLASPWHEDRLAALLVWAEHAKDATRLPTIAKDYLAHTDRINNWDLVDSSADKILGPWVAADPAKRFATIERLAHSRHLWERRIAILTTFHFTRRGDVSPCFRITELLIADPHDLIHKACGWMLREVGKRVSREHLRGFLKAHAHEMPRTMLRYSIEHLDKAERQRWMRA